MCFVVTFVPETKKIFDLFLSFEESLKRESNLNRVMIDKDLNKKFKLRTKR